MIDYTDVRFFNLLVSCGRNLEHRALREIIEYIKELGDDKVIGRPLGLHGLVGVRTSLNVFDIVKRIREDAQQDPWKFKFILKVVPIERMCEANIETIKKCVADLKHKIKKNEKFKVVVRKRSSALSGHDVIYEVAELFDNPVDLENPDKIVAVEIIGNLVGVSILSSEDIVSIAKLKGL
ncbi:MAG: THUMP domain-containing protein [Candidatus Asgardarchaeia archaeon]